MDQSIRLSNQLRITAVLAAIMVILGVVTALAFRTTTRMIRDRDWVAHSQQVLAELQETKALIDDAEDEQRGYLITGDENLLTQFEEILQRFVSKLDPLRRLMADHPAQQQPNRQGDRPGPFDQLRDRSRPRRHNRGRFNAWQRVPVHRPAAGSAARGFEGRTRVLMPAWQSGGRSQSLCQLLFLICRWFGQGRETLAERELGQEVLRRRSPFVTCSGSRTDGRTTSQTARGCLAATLSKTRAGPSGLRRPCSQFRSVFTLIPSIAANSPWDKW